MWAWGAVLPGASAWTQLPRCSQLGSRHIRSYSHDRSRETGTASQPDLAVILQTSRDGSRGPHYTSWLRGRLPVGPAPRIVRPLAQSRGTQSSPDLNREPAVSFLAVRSPSARYAYALVPQKYEPPCPRPRPEFCDCGESLSSYDDPCKMTVRDQKGSKSLGRAGGTRGGRAALGLASAPNARVPGASS